MGQPRKSRKKYNTPPHPWNAERIKDENKLMTKYSFVVKDFIPNPILFKNRNNRYINRTI